jgi:WD40 repeat protein
VRKRPFVGDLSSSFGGTGNGVLAFLSTHSFVPAPPFAVRFAQVRVPPPLALRRAVTLRRLTPPPARSQRPENSHLCLAVDEDGSVRIVDTAAPVRAGPWRAEQPACGVRPRAHPPLLTPPPPGTGRIAQLPATWDERYEYAPLALWTAHDNAVFDAAWTSGDTRIVTASGDQRARLWDVATQQLVASLRGHAGSIKSVSVRPDAPWAIATGARDGNFCLWDTRAAPQPVARSNSLHILPAALYAVRLLLSCSCVCVAGAWTDLPLLSSQSAHEPPVTSRRRSRVAVPPPVSVTCVAFLQDSGALATGGDRDATVRIWDARNLAAPAVRACGAASRVDGP